MSILMKNKSNNKNVMFIKGAPDYLLNNAKQVLTKSGKVVELTAASKKAFDDKIKAYAKKGLRTLAMCYKEDCGQLASYNGPNHPAHALFEDDTKYG